MRRKLFLLGAILIAAIIASAIWLVLPRNSSTYAFLDGHEPDQAAKLSGCELLVYYISTNFDSYRGRARTEILAKGGRLEENRGNSELWRSHRPGCMIYLFEGRYEPILAGSSVVDFNYSSTEGTTVIMQVWDQENL